MLFNIFNNRIIYSGVLRTENPLHIGAGDNSLDPGSTDVSVIKNSKGIPYIPGSSLKGVLRSRLEMMLSVETVKKNWSVSACDIFNYPCITDEFIKSNKDKQRDNPLEYAQLIWEKSCDVCRLFGNKSMAAHVQIKDLELISGGQVELRNGVGIDRETGIAARGVVYEYDVVAAGSEFLFEMIADNLDEKSEKLLNILIKMLEQGEISIGAKTTRGLEKVRIIDLQQSVQTPESLIQQYSNIWGE
jgi:CRISPR-associated protein Csm3